MKTHPDESLPPSNQPTILRYHKPDQPSARWGIPLSAQIIFGVVFTAAGFCTMLFGEFFVGGVVFVLLIPFFIVALHIRLKWDWRGFTIGVFLGLVLAAVSSLFLATL